MKCDLKTYKWTDYAGKSWHIPLVKQAQALVDSVRILAGSPEIRVFYKTADDVIVSSS